ncbi:hypothetical protein N9W34_01525 [Rickettsiales bacterium]|nr:hypothetical protein [Rickettsiales bacterium]
MRNREFQYLPNPFISMTFIIALIFYYFQALPLFSFPDVGWHLMAGKQIVNSGHIPTTDSWSYSANGYYWYNIAWLWDIAIYYINKSIGSDGLFFVVCCLFSLLLALLCNNLLHRKEITKEVVVVVLFIVLLGLKDFVSARAYIPSLFIIIAYHAILHKSRNNLKILLWLPILMVPWVNTHGSFLGGFVIIGAYIIEAYLNKNTKWLFWLILISLLCALATIINPYGIYIYEATYRTLQGTIEPYINEWSPFTFSSNLGVTLFVSVFLLVSGLNRKDIPLAEKIIAYSWLFVSLYSKRHFPTAMLLSAPYLAICLKDMGKPRPLPDLSDKILRLKIFTFASICLILMSTAPIRQYIAGKSRVTNPDTIEVATINYMQANLFDKRILNDYDYGGIIIYYSDGNLPVFIDGRASTAYPKEVIEETINIFTLDEDWLKIIEKYNIQAAVFSNMSPITKFYESGQLKNNWKRVYKGKNASVFTIGQDKK